MAKKKKPAGAKGKSTAGRTADRSSSAPEEEKRASESAEDAADTSTSPANEASVKDEPAEGTERESDDADAGASEESAAADDRDAEATDKKAEKTAEAKTPKKAKGDDAKAARQASSASAAAAREADGEEQASADSTHAPPSHGRHVGAPWAKPLVTLDRWWTWFESRFLFVVLMSLIFFAVGWVALNGLASAVPKEYPTWGLGKKLTEAGTAFRELVGFAALGGLSRLFTRKVKEPVRTFVTIGAIVAGVLLAPVWRGTFVEYADNWSKWIDNGSSFTMFNRLSGWMSRLTILLAMLGASLAAGAGKHIYIDVVQRFVAEKWRRVMFAITTLATVTVCFVCAWGFVDEIAVEYYSADVTASPTARVGHMLHEVNNDLFLWRKQIGCDLSTFSHVLGGGKWDDKERMNGRQWNDFINNGGFRDHFPSSEVDQLLATESQLNTPWPMQVYRPPHGQPLGSLTHAMSLMFPFGLIVIGLRFLLRMILVLTGHQPLEAESDDKTSVKETAEAIDASAAKSTAKEAT